MRVEEFPLKNPFLPNPCTECGEEGITKIVIDRETEFFMCCICGFKWKERKFAFRW